MIRGWINYYAIGDMYRVMMKIDAHLRTELKVILWKQWRRYHCLRKLGDNHNLARQASYMKDHNQFVMTETCIVKALSKQRLTNNGLVSCLDCYLIRHKLKFN
ncbi:group II intron maturase-specific domain-containing protein [Faecalibacillus faecis]|uniref:group II intron maturase-specific domain-containing protein n=1 Tax=Faecalibacillus faecis TaxID=1982628 RepID=UPI003AB16595